MELVKQGIHKVKTQAETELAKKEKALSEIRQQLELY